jgi:hypothetical protein
VSIDLQTRDDRSLPLKRPRSWRKVALLLATFVVFGIAAVASWLIVKPGDTLLWPMAIDVAIFVLFGVACQLALGTRIGRLGRSGYALAFLGLGVASLLWTYFGVLPVSVAFDSTGASVARHEIARGAQGCQLIEQGSVGLLRAPYKICSDLIPGASRIEFATPDLFRGYAYVTGPSDVNWFPDQCARRLIGNWWAFFNEAASTVNGCPIGYSFHGGG